MNQALDSIIPFQEDKVWSVNQGGNEGAEPNNIDAMDDKTGSNSDDKVVKYALLTSQSLYYWACFIVTSPSRCLKITLVVTLLN